MATGTRGGAAAGAGKPGGPGWELPPAAGSKGAHRVHKHDYFVPPMPTELYSESKYHVYWDEDDIDHKYMTYPPGMKRLDLTNLTDKDLPTNLPLSLEHLDIQASCDYIPPSISRLTKLRVLRISSSHLKTLPPELGLLTGLRVFYMAYCPRMDPTITRLYNMCTSLPLHAGKRPDILFEHLRSLIGKVTSIAPRRPVKQTERALPFTRRKKAASATGDGLGPTPLKKKKKKKKLKKVGSRLGKLMHKDRSAEEEGALTFEQKSYERDLREWNDFVPRPQPPMPKHMGVPIYDVDHKVDTSNWVIIGTDRKPNQRFVSKYDFLAFTLSRPNKHTIFEVDPKTKEAKCRNPL